MGRKRFLLLLLIVLAVSMLFVALNAGVVRVELAVITLDAPLGLALVCALALGLVIGVLIRGAWVAELLSERGRLRRALKAAEARARARAGEGETSTPLQS